MYYKITYETNENDKKYMYFKFNESVGANEFVKKFKNNKFKISPATTNLDFNCDYDFISEKANELNFHVSEFNKLQSKDPTQNLFFPVFEFSGDVNTDKQLLNELHARFESYAGTNLEAFPGRNKIRSAKRHLDRINNNIHMLEQRLPYYYSQNENPLVYSRISYTTKNKRHKMQEIWYGEFSMQIKFGDLRMNYATRGKNIEHLFVDNDMVHISSGGRPTPQAVFNEGIHAHFGGYLKNKISDDNVIRSHEVGASALQNWYDENQLEQYGIENTPSQCAGYIILGEYYPMDPINMDSTIEDVLNYYSDCTRVVNYEIAEEL